MASTIKLASYPSAVAITITLASLASGSSYQSAAVDNTTDLYIDAMVYVKVKLQTGTPSGDKMVYLYVAGSEDGTNYPYPATGSNGSITMIFPPNVRSLGNIYCPDSGGLSFPSSPFSVAAAFQGLMPRKWSLIVQNATGVTFSATEGDHTKEYTGQPVQIV